MKPAPLVLAEIVTFIVNQQLDHRPLGLVGSLSINRPCSTLTACF
jgi:hypothetical protein